MTEDEEEIYAAFGEGAMTGDAAQAALQAIGAMNTEIQLVRG